MSQNLTTNIVINARTGSGFTQVGNTLMELGTLVNGLSQELINFGKESIKVYRDYEKSMASAEVALSTTYGRGTTELTRVMNQLDKSATQWAATTIFHTNDVGNAISEAAHAGWDYEQIMTGLPAAMKLAQAGGLDLSEAVDYIVKSTYAAGISFEDLTSFIDQWTFASNSSASTIGEFGDAMLRMGSTMRFTGSTEELMTLLAVTANAGSVGSAAGTMIRNSLIRLLAPTKKANDAMKQLGATSEEMAEALGDQRLIEANERLSEFGFSAYDQSGNLRSILDIYNDLYVALGAIAGGYEDIGRNEDAIRILSSIFPTRTITEALNLLRGASENYDGLYEKMQEGAAEGYGAYAAQTMMDTLDGSITIFESKVERLKQLVGTELKGQVVDVAEWAGELVDGLAEMDPAMFSAVISGLEVLAAAGPSLLAAGVAFRLMGLLMTPAGGITAGLIALTTAAVMLKDLEKSDFASLFGTLEIDSAELQQSIHAMGDEFRQAYEQVDNFRQALDESVNAYETAGSTLSGKLLTAMITGAKLTPEDKAAMMELGEQMHSAVLEAIENRRSESTSFWSYLFAGDETDTTFQNILGVVNGAAEEAITEADAISRQIKNALTSAFADGEISDEEYQKILNYMRSYNDAVARAATEAQSEDDYVKMQKMLHQAQTASADEIQSIAQTAAQERETALTKLEEDYLTERFRLQYRGADEATLAAAEARYQQRRAETAAGYDNLLMSLYDSQFRQSGMGDNYAWLEGIAGQYLSGGLTGDAALAAITATLGNSGYAGQNRLPWQSKDREDLGKALGLWVNAMGGEDAIARQIGYYDQQGNTDMADQLRSMYAMSQLINGFEEIYSVNGTDVTTTGQIDAIRPQVNRNAAEAALGIGQSAVTIETAKATLAALGLDTGYFATLGQVAGGASATSALYGARGELPQAYRDQISALFQGLSTQYDFSAILANDTNWLNYGGYGMFKNDYALWQLLFGGASGNPEDFLLAAAGTMQDAGPIPVPIQPHVEGADSAAALEEQGVSVDVTADSTELQATIDGADGQTLIEYLDGDATGLHMTIMGEDGQKLTEIVNGNTTNLANAIQRFNGQTIMVNIQGRRLFASGGRATSASVFGEAGPEWAIPEEHSQRTAGLLNAARAASGFSWGELLGLYGGLNADPENKPTTIIYSPTVYAQNAEGVDNVLQEDKKRLNKWFEERKMRDAMEVYA